MGIGEDSPVCPDPGNRISGTEPLLVLLQLVCVLLVDRFRRWSELQELVDVWAKQIRSNADDRTVTIRN